ncbi:MAG: TraB domain-containing protein [Syntrophotaleaceae bacterium]
METAACSDICRLHVADKEIILIGTAHISRDSVDTVRRVIAEETPDSVCIELDHQRYRSLTDQQGWQSLDLVKAIRQGQGLPVGQPGAGHLPEAHGAADRG